MINLSKFDTGIWNRSIKPKSSNLHYMLEKVREKEEKNGKIVNEKRRKYMFLINGNKSFSEYKNTLNSQCFKSKIILW
jgi:hypothetical protein